MNQFYFCARTDDFMTNQKEIHPCEWLFFWRVQLCNLMSLCFYSFLLFCFLFFFCLKFQASLYYALLRLYVCHRRSSRLIWRRRKSFAGTSTSAHSRPRLCSYRVQVAPTRTTVYSWRPSRSSTRTSSTRTTRPSVHQPTISSPWTPARWRKFFAPRPRPTFPCCCMVPGCRNKAVQTRRFER